MIGQKQKLTIMAGIAVFLVSVFILSKIAPVTYSAGKELFYHERGYFKADNGTFGGPGCGVCVQEGRASKNSPWQCVFKRPGITGYFTKDSACKRAYGPSMIEGADFGVYKSPVSLCGLESAKFHKVECILPLLPPCAEWKDGVCQKVDTSLLQGGDKSKGTMSTTPAEFVVRIFTIILGFAGGIALLLIIFAGYKILMSKGKPEGIQQGRDQLISAIVGLVFIIFSFVIFQLIFADIFKIPGIY